MLGGHWSINLHFYTCMLFASLVCFFCSFVCFHEKGMNMYFTFLFNASTVWVTCSNLWSHCHFIAVVALSHVGIIVVITALFSLPCHTILCCCHETLTLMSHSQPPCTCSSDIEKRRHDGILCQLYYIPFFEKAAFILFTDC